MGYQGLRHFTCLLLIASMFSCGCAAIKAYPDRSVSLKDQLLSLQWCFEAQKVSSPPVGETPVTWRNEVVNCRIQAIDLQFTSFEQDLAAESVGLNTGVDMSVVGLGAATSIVGGATSKAILGAISGGIVGAKGIMDKDIFYSKTMPALLSQMEAQRKTQLVKIRSGLQKPVDGYPLSEALIDVEEYYKAGSIPAAVQGIIEQSGATGKAATDQLKLLVTASAKDVQTITSIRTRFNELYNGWQKSPESAAGKTALANAKKILKILEPGSEADNQAVFDALDSEIGSAEPGSEQFKKVADAFNSI
ncbi:MAG: hypothetical protein ACLPX5_07780 [Dissulfurispiraceae bacterium]